MKKFVLLSCAPGHRRSLSPLDVALPKPLAADVVNYGHLARDPNTLNLKTIHASILGLWCAGRRHHS